MLLSYRLWHFIVIEVGFNNSEEQIASIFGAEVEAVLSLRKSGTYVQDSAVSYSQNT